jgi:hypothetical protein
VTSWYEDEKRSRRLRQHLLDVLPLAVVLVGLVLFLAFWGS